MKINDIISETGVGGIAVVAQPLLGAPISRPNPSIYNTTAPVKRKKKRKTPKE